MSNASDAQAVKKRQRQAELRKLQAREDATWALSDPRGRRFVQRLRRACGYRAALPYEGAAAIHALGRLEVWQVIDESVRQVDARLLGTMEAELDDQEWPALEPGPPAPEA